LNCDDTEEDKKHESSGKGPSAAFSDVKEEGECQTRDLQEHRKGSTKGGRIQRINED